MSLVVGLLEQHELSARRRVEELREEADGIQAELALSELEWNEWAIARSRVGAVLVPENGNVDARAARDLRDAAKPETRVPVWREGLGWAMLSVDYRRILQALTDRHDLRQGPLTCQEMAAVFGMDVVPATVEALRSKATRLVARGWLAESAARPVHASRPRRLAARRWLMRSVIDQ
ncbi:hypothetical protein [Streptomyces sp. NBC_01614]|uniref:hypothetical protein n=1 Tax=Streptomyces sp. NBC_01614 TaxID=2975897 RepID=UPI00386F1149